MPQMANITVKKNDGTTDIVYTAMQPSSGDGVQAVWKATAVGTAPAHQPELRLSARSVASGSRREVRVTYMYPEIATNSTTGTTSVVFRERAAATFTLDSDASITSINETVAQFAHLLNSALVVGSVQSGYGPT